MEQVFERYEYEIKEGTHTHTGSFTLKEGVKSPIKNAIKVQKFIAFVRG